MGDVCRELALPRAGLLLSGPVVVNIAGKRVLASLLDAGYKVDLELIKGTAKADLAKLVRIARNFKFIVAVGGGKVIDIAKWVGTRLRIPFISVPTAPSHDGIASPRATIFDSAGRHHSYAAQTPLAVVVDMDIISKAPYRMIAAGAADVIAKITAVADWKLSHEQTGEYLSEYAAAMALLSAEMVIGSAYSIRTLQERGLRNLVEALINSGIAMCIAGSSRPASGSEHLFSHALDAILPSKSSLHGEQCGIGSIMAAYLHGEAWQQIRDTLMELGAPTSARELGIPADMIVRALVRAKDVRADRYTILHQVNLSANQATRLAMATKII
jgi:glycerol-1-phosphate dehydrogenase [NAD(P)+]